MKKKRAIRNFILIGIALLILLILTIFNFTIPFTDYRFNGFIGGLSKSIDINGGVSATYKVTTADYYKGSIDDARNDAIDRINYLITKYYGEGRITKVDDNKLNIAISDSAVSNNLTVGMIEMKQKEGKPTQDEIIVTGQHIKKISYKNVEGQNGVMIEFNDSGSKLYEDLTKAISSNGTTSGKMYIYINQNYDSAFSTPEIKEINNYGYTYISSTTMTTKKATEIYCDKLNSCLLGINMEQIGEENEVAPLFGNYSKYFALALAITIVLIIFIALICMYKDLGLLASISLLFNIMLPLIFVPCFSIQFSFVSLLGYLLGFIFATLFHIIMIEKIKQTFSSGKKLMPSIKAGYMKGLFVILDSLAIIGVPAIIISIATSGAIRSLCANIVFGLIISAFTSLLVFKALITNYSAFNSTNGKKFNFVKGVDYENK